MPIMNLGEAISVDNDYTISNKLEGRLKALSSAEYGNQTYSEFWEGRKNVDYRNFDFSALAGQDTEIANNDDYTTSEKDTINLFKDIVLLEQSQDTFSPEENQSRLDGMSPQEQYIEIINNEYLQAASESTKYLVQMKYGYNENWMSDSNNKDTFNIEKKSFNSKIATAAEGMEIAHQVYSYKMAMVKGEKDVPKTDLTFKVPDRWNVTAIRDLNRRITNGTALNNHENDKAFEACGNMYDAIFGHFKRDTGYVGKPIEEFDNIFIDGVSVADYCKKFAPADEAGKEKIYKATIVNAITSGEHTVETGIRCMDKDGHKNMQLFSVEPDLTAIATAERARRSWFRRLFDWGPFKISTCQSKQAKRRSADSIDAKISRHESINDKYKLSDKANANYEKKIKVTDKVNLNKQKTAKKGPQKMELADWLKKTGETYKAEIGSEGYEHSLKLILMKQKNWNLRKGMVVATEKFGLENAINLFSKANHGNIYADANTIKTINEMQKIDEEYISKANAQDTYDKVMDYYFTHGAVENSDSQMILEIAKELATTDIQKEFVRALKTINSGREQYDIELQKACEYEYRTNYAEYDNLVAPTNDQIEIIQKGQVQIKLNKVLCDTISSQISEGKPFSSEMLWNNKAVGNILDLAENEGTKYKNLLNQVTTEVNSGENKPSNITDLLKEIHSNINSVPQKMKESISNVIENKKASMESASNSLEASTEEPLKTEQKVTLNQVIK